jgi:hypothetical protein
MGMLVLNISCSENQLPIHKGKRLMSHQLSLVDSIMVDADATSGRGNFFMADSFVYFADCYYMALYQYKQDGTFVKRHFGKGQGPNELVSLKYSYPIKDSKGECFLIDPSNIMFSYNTDDYHLKRRGRLGFGWENVDKDNYDSPSVYNIMEMSDFGINMIALNDTLALVPVSLVDRLLSGVSVDRYHKGHILAELNLQTMKVEKVVGKLPMIYMDKPTPLFEFFQYDMAGDTLFVNHAVDSLIYVYRYPDQLLYTMGYEVENVNREYTKGYEIDMKLFTDDLKKVGSNIGLTYVPDENLLFKTVLESFSNRKTCLQVYKGNDLILEAEMPPYFQFLGYENGVIHGVRMRPLETEDEYMYFIFYQYKLEAKN